MTEAERRDGEGTFELVAELQARSANHSRFATAYRNGGCHGAHESLMMIKMNRGREVKSERCRCIVSSACRKSLRRIKLRRC